MLSPAAEFIEMAKDAIPTIPDWLRLSQQKELHVATGRSDAAFCSGYELGLQTARVIIAMSVTVQLAKIKPENIL